MTQHYLSSGWKLNTIARDQVEIANATSSVQSPFFLYWYHFPFHRSQSTLMHNSQLPHTLGFGWLWLRVMLKFGWVRFLLPSVLYLLHAVKTNKITKILFVVYIASLAVFSHFFPEKKLECPSWEKIFTLTAHFIGRLRLLHQSKYAT